MTNSNSTITQINVNKKITTKWSKDLVNWYQKNHRKLPWRIDAAPYHTLVSEFMAQQTQIITLIPYYKRWLIKFPSITDVAIASEDQILKQWEGLGYYSRARNLHKTCQIIINEQNGKIPDSFEALKKLPGIGNYIAAAISSIAFNKSIPVVDGNVLRVITRLYGIDNDISKEKTKQNIQNRLTPIIKNLDPGEFNQGVMELGALICTPKKPTCNFCPINRTCHAFNNQEIDKYPVKPKKAPTPHYTIVVGIIQNKQGDFLITKRKKNQLLGGLWEFPGGKVESKESFETALHREIQEELSIKISVKHQLCKVKHAYSHFKITLHAFMCTTTDTKIMLNSADDFCWVKKEEFNNFAFPKANKVILKNLEALY